MKFTIDRFESDYAIVELDDNTLAEMPKVLIPKEAKEGDVLEIRIYVKKTKKRKIEIDNLMDELFEN